MSIHGGGAVTSRGLRGPHVLVVVVIVGRVSERDPRRPRQNPSLWGFGGERTGRPKTGRPTLRAPQSCGHFPPWRKTNFPRALREENCTGGAAGTGKIAQEKTQENGVLRARGE